MPPNQSTSGFLSALRRGDEQAAQRLWGDYFQRLVGLARNRLRHAPRRAADEEDVALSALDSFFNAARRNALPRLDDEDDLWRVLVVFTVRKASYSPNSSAHTSRTTRSLRSIELNAIPSFSAISLFA
jgi:ECF sigma factor